jgi:hypothetical protein
MILTDTNAFSAAASEAGLAQVIALQGLAPSSPVLDHCDRIDALGPRARALAARYPAYIAAVRSEGGKLVASGEIPSSGLDSMIHNFTQSQQPFNRQWTLGGELAGHAGRLCRILARRHWSNGPRGEVRFTDAADRADADIVRAQIEPVVNEVNALGANARAQSMEAMGRLERQ